MKKVLGFYCLIFGFALASSLSVNAQPFELHETSHTKKIVLEGPVNGNVYYSDGILIFKEKRSIGDRWFFADTSAHIIAKDVRIVTGSLDPVPVFSDGFAITRPTEFHIIDKKGQSVEELSEYYLVGEQFVDGVVLALKKPSNKYSEERELCYLGLNGSVKYPELTQRISRWVSPKMNASPIRDGRRLHRDYTKNLFGYLDASGRMVIAPRFTDAKDFSEGLAAVQMETPNGKKWGFINTQGTFVIEPKFANEPGSFHDGWAVVTKNSGKMTYCSKDGSIMPVEFDRCIDFMGGYSLCEEWMSPKVFTIEGKVLPTSHRLPYIRDVKYIRELNPPLAYQSDGIFSVGFKPLLSGYGSFRYLGDGLFWFGANHVNYKSGIVRSNGEYVILFEISEF